MRIKDAQNMNDLKVRWVHSEAQLANGLTKGKDLRQLMPFYDMEQCWRIVEDPKCLQREDGKLRARHHWKAPSHPATARTTYRATTSRGLRFLVCVFLVSGMQEVHSFFRFTHRT